MQASHAKLSKHISLTVALFLISYSALFAQVLEPVKWSYESKLLDNNEAELIFKATIDDTWHLYSQNITDGGPVKTSFFFNDLKGVEFIGIDPNITEEEGFDPGTKLYRVTFSEPEPIEEVDPNFDMVVKYFGHEAEFKQRVKLPSDEPLVLDGFLEFMCCDDSKCLPPAEFEFEFTFNQDENTAAQTEPEKTPEPVKDNSPTEFTSELTGEGQTSYWGFFIFSFIAGLLAILTPCVFPMIPMTVSFFMKSGENKAKGRMEATIYGFSIIIIYVFIGSVLAVIAGPDIANWLSTHWLPNIIFFLIFVIFAASFFGMFEIVMPSWLVNKSAANEDKGGFTGPVFMALTLVLVSFSCTGPIVGTILVEAAGGEFVKPIVGMLGFSLAFALPFTLFAFFPQYLDRLPKSGGWLNSVKVVLGFLELALGLKFLSVADQTYHWGILDREVYIALWVVIFFLMGVYLLGKIKFAHDSDVKYLSVPRLFFAIITFSFVVYLLPGMWGAPLKALSGYMPPMHTHDFDMTKIIRENGGTATLEQELCEKPKYSDFLHLPHGLEGYFDYEQALACAKEQNKPIFIDFTGHGCVNCREMEANVWADPKVLKMLREDYIVTALYVDDKSRLPEEDWIVSEYDGKVKKTVGKKYADFQISRFNTNAQPYYVLLDTNGEMLASPRAYDLDIDEFIDFLERGLKEFEKRSPNKSSGGFDPTSL
jgi:thiol:disulfide interchange protein DsbD